MERIRSHAESWMDALCHSQTGTAHFTISKTVGNQFKNRKSSFKLEGSKRTEWRREEILDWLSTGSGEDVIDSKVISFPCAHSGWLIWVQKSTQILSIRKTHIVSFYLWLHLLKDHDETIVSYLWPMHLLSIFDETACISCALTESLILCSLSYSQLSRIVR